MFGQLFGLCEMTGAHEKYEVLAYALLSWVHRNKPLHYESLGWMGKLFSSW